MRFIYCVILLAACLCSTHSYAASFYDKILSQSDEFKKLDSELNKVYKELIEKMSSGEVAILRADQRYWWKNEFDSQRRDYEYRDLDETQAAIKVLQRRVDDLKKLQSADNTDSIVGLPIKLGMARDELYSKLDKDKLDTYNDTYTTELMGETVTIAFKFKKIKFIGPPSYVIGDEDNKVFKEEADKIGKAFLSKMTYSTDNGNRPHCDIKVLISVIIGFGGDTRQRTENFSDAFIRKYKKIYVEEEVIKTINSLPQSVYYFGGRRGLFESSDKYILLNFGGGQYSWEFDIVYIDKGFIFNCLTDEDIVKIINDYKGYKNNIFTFNLDDNYYTVIKRISDKNIELMHDSIYIDTSLGKLEFKFDGGKLYAWKLNLASWESDILEKIKKRLSEQYKEVDDKESRLTAYNYWQSMSGNTYFDAGSNYILVYFLRSLGNSIEVIDKNKFNMITSDMIDSHKKYEESEKIKNKKAKEMFSNDIGVF